MVEINKKKIFLWAFLLFITILFSEFIVPWVGDNRGRDCDQYWVAVGICSALWAYSIYLWGELSIIPWISKKIEKKDQKKATNKKSRTKKHRI